MRCIGKKKIGDLKGGQMFSIDLVSEKLPNPGLCIRLAAVAVIVNGCAMPRASNYTKGDSFIAIRVSNGKPAMYHTDQEVYVYE
jgi:hypothetical protein